MGSCCKIRESPYSNVLRVMFLRLLGVPKTSFASLQHKEIIEVSSSTSSPFSSLSYSHHPMPPSRQY